MSAKQQRASRKTITFQPAPDVLSLLSKAIVRKVGRNGDSRGLVTKLINEAIRIQHAALMGKRELPKGKIA